MSLDKYTADQKEPKINKAKRVRKSPDKISTLEEKVKQLEKRVQELEADNGELVTENLNAILFLKEKGFEGDFEKIFPLTRLWEDNDLMNQSYAIGFPLVFQEESKKDQK